MKETPQFRFWKLYHKRHLWGAKGGQECLRFIPESIENMSRTLSLYADSDSKTRVTSLQRFFKIFCTVPPMKPYLPKTIKEWSPRITWIFHTIIFEKTHALQKHGQTHLNFVPSYRDAGTHQITSFTKMTSYNVLEQTLMRQAVAYILLVLKGTSHHLPVLSISQVLPWTALTLFKLTEYLIKIYLFNTSFFNKSLIDRNVQLFFK